MHSSPTFQSNLKHTFVPPTVINSLTQRQDMKTHKPIHYIELCGLRYAWLQNAMWDTQSECHRGEHLSGEYKIPTAYVGRTKRRCDRP